MLAARIAGKGTTHETTSSRLVADRACGRRRGERPSRQLCVRSGPQVSPLMITGLKVTPIAVPDPPLLAASGCHGPYFLRNVVELRTEGGIVGIGETHGGSDITRELDRAGSVPDWTKRVRLSEICARRCKR